MKITYEQEGTYEQEEDIKAERDIRSLMNRKRHKKIEEVKSTYGIIVLITIHILFLIHTFSWGRIIVIIL